MTQTPPPPNKDKKERPHILAARVLEADMTYEKPAAQVLYDQAALLDALFAQLLQDSITTRKKLMSGEPYRYVDADAIDMALRAQKQCRQTLDALALRTQNPNQKSSPQGEEGGVGNAEK